MDMLKGMADAMKVMGSNDHPSVALPVNWQRWAEYRASSVALAKDSADLAEIAENGLDETSACAIRQARQKLWYMP